MIGANCNLEVLEIVLTEYRKHEETKESTVSVSSKDVSSSGVSTVHED